MSDTPERLADVLRIAEEALARDGADRAAHLDAACGADADLRREVEAVLAEQASCEDFLDTPPWQRQPAKLVAGQRLGPYQIEAAIGAGGMGEVYKARDTRLDRTVAIKVLPPEATTRPERRARFEREAKAIAALSHPNICPLFDVGHENGVDFLVMEHLEGQTLAARLEKGRLPLDQALAIGAQIADALSAAHRLGVIHRDLKPANVMLVKAPGGGRGAVEAKLLDFGLAKLARHGEEDVASPLASAKAILTAEGTIVGTLQYMAPEQVEGKPADVRADIWALGTILYEMVTGRRAFEAPSAASLVAAILEHEPAPVVSLQPLTPPALQHAIARCLTKDPDARWDSARDLAAELRWIHDTSEPGVIHDRPSHGRRWMVLGLVGLVILSTLVAWFVRRPPAEPVATTLTAYSGMESQPSFSPDGTKVAFTWNGENEDNDDIYVKQIGSAGNPLRLTISPAVEAMPAWSPDDRWIAFTRAQEGRQNFAIVLVPPLGGAERVLTEARGRLTAPTGPGGLCWTPDGKWLLFSDGGAEGWMSIAALSVDTGERRPLTRYMGTTSNAAALGDTYPSISPDGRTLAFARGTRMAKDLYVMPLAEDLRPAGEPIRVTERNYASISGMGWLPNEREIVYSAGSVLAAGLWRVNASRNQVPQRLAFAAVDASFPTIAARCSRLAYTWRVANGNLWRLDLRTGERVRLVASSYTNALPQYSPDGRKIAFQSNRSGNREVWTCDADGSRCLQVTSFGGPTCGTPRWSPDGRRIVMDAYVSGSPEVYVVAADGGAPRRMTTPDYGNRTPSWSPDGRWLYFTSDRTGRSEIWKMPAAGGEAAQVTRAGGSSALSSPDGRYLYYVKEPGLTFLYRMPAAGGEEERVVAEALEAWNSFGVTAKGVFFKTREALKFFDAATRKVTTLALIATIGDYGICVSPDDRYVVWGQKDRYTSDLMLVENFR